MVLYPDSNVFLSIGASIAAVVNRNGIKILLANGLSTFFIKDNIVFSHGSNILPRNSPDCPIFCNWIFDIFILAEELFAKD